MNTFLVEMHGEAREVYSVTAESAEDAADNWASGTLIVSEASGMDLYSVTEDSE